MNNWHLAKYSRLCVKHFSNLSFGLLQDYKESAIIPTLQTRNGGTDQLSNQTNIIVAEGQSLTWNLGLHASLYGIPTQYTIHLTQL